MTTITCEHCGHTGPACVRCGALATALAQKTSHDPLGQLTYCEPCDEDLRRWGNVLHDYSNACRTAWHNNEPQPPLPELW